MPEVTTVKSTGEAKGDTIREKEQALALTAKAKLDKAVELTNEIYKTGGKKELVREKVAQARNLIAQVHNGELEQIDTLRKNQ